MSIRIAKLTLYKVLIPLKRKIRHASHVRKSTDSIIVRCDLSNGMTGWGEGLPREYVTGETIDDVFPLVDEADLSSQLGEPFDSIADVLQLAESFSLGKAHDPRRCFGNSIRCAVELALLDAVCRSFEIPLAEITSQYPPAFAIREKSEQVRYSGAIMSMKPWKQKLNAWLIRLNRFHQTKVKVGADGIDDVASLARIRHILRNDIDIRIDANEAWACDSLAKTVEPLLRFGISSLEQPVPHEDAAGLAALRGQIGLDLMLDESLCSEVDAHRAIEDGLCDLFNIRLSKCGGFIPSLKLATIANQAGLGYQLGCQVGETGILSAAGRHFASSVANIRYIEGSYDRYLVKQRLTKEDLTFGRRGIAPALERPGLGVTVSETRLKKVTQSSRVIKIN